MSGIKGEIEFEEPAREERAAGRRAAEARATVPDLELGTEVDIDACLALPHSLTAALVRACALALQDVPRANGSYRDGRFELHSRVNIGVAIAHGDLVVVPTLFDADRKQLAELDEEIGSLRARAREDSLTSPELTGATFTVTDAGVYPVARVAPLIVAPQAAGVAAGAVREVPVVRGGAIVAGHVLSLTLVCDHRILFGVQAARFLSRIKQLLEDANL